MMTVVRLCRTISVATLATLFLAASATAQDPVVAISRGKLNKVSARIFVQSGDNVGIAGFIISGGNKQVVVRGLGPSLAVNGVPLANRLANPVLTLYNASGSVITSNDDWRSTQQQEIQNDGLAPANYTAVIRGAGGTTGNALAEVYHLADG